MITLALTLALASPAPPAKDTTAIVRALVEKHGPGIEARAKRGVDQVASLWRVSDGDMKAFVLEHFIPDDKTVTETFMRYEAMMEQLDGHFTEMGRELKRPTEVEMGPMLSVDPLFSSFDTSAHLVDDLFDTKLAFVALLNFPMSTLEQRIADGGTWSRDTWAEARLMNRFSRRVPADINKKSAEVAAAADLYIAEYNLWMHHVLDRDGNRIFPSGKRLISHWNLRDELKAQYANGADGTTRQRTIVKLMERIVTQTIPASVINNPRIDYNPFTNETKPAPADTVEADAPPPVDPPSGREPDTRYAYLLAQFQAAKAADPYSPIMPSAIQRSFEMGREMTEARVKQLLENVLTSPLVPQVAKEIERRLGRSLEPQDLWYDGFKARSSIPEQKLDEITKKRYPTSDAFKKDLPRILEKIGFKKDKAKFLAEHILVDPSRGAGHAMQAARRGDFPRLRTRVEPGGMNYKGFNIAVHELGHNVEQVFSLYEVDHTLLQGVPNNAFTEAVAFTFQSRDLDLLDMKNKDAAATKRENTLADFWATWEIAGVALVDVGVWHWLYEHPQATPAELREATNQIALEVWRKYYAPVLGGASDGASATPLLGIYSHMIAYPLYLADYPLGHLIAFQIEEAITAGEKKGQRFGDEIERMTKVGNIAPDLWMQNASGAPVSAEPLLRATEKALADLPKTTAGARP